MNPSPPIAAALESAANAAGVEVALLRAVAFVESRFNPLAHGPVTPKGWRAKGLMQLGPDALTGVPDPWEPKANALAGARQLSQLIHKYHDVSKALAAYNWGSGNVDVNKTVPAQVATYVARVLDRLDVERIALGGAATRPLPPPLPDAPSSSQHLLTCPSCLAVVVVQTDLRVRK